MNHRLALIPRDCAFKVCPPRETASAETTHAGGRKGLNGSLAWSSIFREGLLEFPVSKQLKLFTCLPLPAERQRRAVSAGLPGASQRPPPPTTNPAGWPDHRPLTPSQLGSHPWNTDTGIAKPAAFLAGNPANPCFLALLRALPGSLSPGSLPYGERVVQRRPDQPAGHTVQKRRRCRAHSGRQSLSLCCQSSISDD